MLVSQMLEKYDQPEESESEATQSSLSMSQNAKKRPLTGSDKPEPSGKREQRILSVEGELEVNLFPGRSDQSIQSNISGNASTSEGKPSILNLEQVSSSSTLFTTKTKMFSINYRLTLWNQQKHMVTVVFQKIS